MEKLTIGMFRHDYIAYAYDRMVMVVQYVSFLLHPRSLTLLLSAEVTHPSVTIVRDFQSEPGISDDILTTSLKAGEERES